MRVFSILPQSHSISGETIFALLNSHFLLYLCYLYRYGSSANLVLTTGNGVNGYTLDAALGEFILTHPDVRLFSPSPFHSLPPLDYLPSSVLFLLLPTFPLILITDYDFLDISIPVISPLVSGFGRTIVHGSN